MADSLLQTIREGTEKGNAYRRSKGVPEMTITGWITPPQYDEVSNNLVWAFGASSKNGQEANYDTRILGRTGVMSVKLVAGAEEIKPAIPTVKAMLTNFQYKPGHRYSEVRAGDKIAQYGLTGLITGGVILAAAKSGLLTKFWKLIVVGEAALFGGIWRGLDGQNEDFMTGFQSLGDGQQILAILAILYFSEGGCWLPRSAVCFSAAWRQYRPLPRPPPS